LKNKVRTLREAMCLTQAELAKLAGASRQAINAIEIGKFDPSIRLAYSLVTNASVCPYVDGFKCRLTTKTLSN